MKKVKLYDENTGINYSESLIVNESNVEMNKYNMSHEQIMDKLSRLNLDEITLRQIFNCIDKNLVVYITGPHGPTGKTSLCRRLNEIGIPAIELDINNILYMGKVIE